MGTTVAGEGVPHCQRVDLG